MSLLPDDATFHERVQDCFVAYRGHGVSLSGKDLELLDAWAARAVPFEVVARGLRKAAEAAFVDAPGGERALRSLAQCRRQVDKEITRYLALVVGKTAEGAVPAEVPFHLARHQKLRKALDTIAREHPQLAPGLTRWLPRLTPPADFTAGARQEELAWALLVRALPGPARRELLRAARDLVQKADLLTVSARRESLRFHRAALVRQALSLPSFW